MTALEKFLQLEKLCRRDAGCLLLSTDGRYISIRFNGESWKAHRLSFVAHRGPVPIGKEVCHSCDHPNCINPDHLWAGTHKENLWDARRKGRWGIDTCVFKDYRDTRLELACRMEERAEFIFCDNSIFPFELPKSVSPSGWMRNGREAAIFDAQTIIQPAAIAP